MTKLSLPLNDLIQQHQSSLAKDDSSLLFVCNDGIVGTSLAFFAHCSPLLKAVKATEDHNNSIAISLPDFTKPAVEKALTVLTTGKVLLSSDDLGQFYEFLGTMMIDLKSVDLKTCSSGSSTRASLIEMVELTDDEGDLQIIADEPQCSTSSALVDDNANMLPETTQDTMGTETERDHSLSASLQVKDEEEEVKHKKREMDGRIKPKPKSKKKRKTFSPIKGANFRCFHCHNAFPSKPSLLTHMSQSHYSSELLRASKEFIIENGESWKCSLCDETFGGEVDCGSVLVHFGAEHEKVLQYLPRNEDKLKRSKDKSKNRRSMGVADCMLCARQCPSSSALKQHLSIKHFIRQLWEALDCKLECPDCERIFPSRARIVFHYGAKHNRVLEFLPDEQRARLLAMSSTPHRTHKRKGEKRGGKSSHKVSSVPTVKHREDYSASSSNNNKIVKCLICRKICRNVSTLKQHLSVNHYSDQLSANVGGSDVMKCPVCNKSLPLHARVVEHCGVKHNMVLQVASEQVRAQLAQLGVREAV